MRKLLVIALILAGMMAVGSANAALRYRGKAWSSVVGGTQQDRIVLNPTTDPSWWAGTIRCHALTPGVACLAPVATVAVQFTNGGFYANLGGGVCYAQGSGSPGTPLSGNYACVNGDAGTVYFHPVH